MRAQYHLRKSPRGLLAWDVRKLLTHTQGLEPEEVPLSAIRELDEPFWYDAEGDAPTCRSVAQHARLVEEAELCYPILLDPEGRVMDGMHRVCKALNLDHKAIRAYRLRELPPPDFIGVPAEELPYDD